MTAHQQSKLNQLASEYRSTRVREDAQTLSVFVDCYDISTPELCVQCGQEAIDHVAGAAHYFMSSYPVAQFRVSPSGFQQRLDPIESAA